MRLFTASVEDSKKRLDVFIVEQLPQLSRAFVQKLCDRSKILVNDQPAKAGYRLRTKDKVGIDYNLNKFGNVATIDLPILYEDDDCVVIDKPTGLLSHSKGAFNPEPTVATWLSRHITSNGTSNREGIVHRLDRGTSGVMICAKTENALSWLQKQFSTRKVKKVYLAIIKGSLEPAEAIIDMPIERNPKHPQTFRVGTTGKPATTVYETLKSNDNYSLVKLTPQTGRTHQLRVHLKQLGHPIIGDNLYGGEPANRLYLHALSLELTLPSHQRRTFEAALPKEFNKITG